MQAKDLKPGWFFDCGNDVLRMAVHPCQNGFYCARKSMPEGLSFVGDAVEVTHHPDCTGWDWPIPKRVRLEVGKRYVMRCGEITGRLAKQANEHYPFGDERNSWDRGGLHCCNYDLRKHRLDIISEYVEPQAVTVAPCDCEHVPFTQTTFKPHRQKWLIENSMPDLWLRAERVRPDAVLIGSCWIEWDRLLSGFRFLGGGVCGEEACKS